MSKHAPLQPYDEFNQALESNVHPKDWQNPNPSERYNLVVIGGGTAGLVSAMGAAGLGAKVALIERELLGGDCLNVGCIPSKSMLSVGRFIQSLRRAETLGIELPGDPKIQFPEIMARVRKLRADISPHDSAERFRSAGIDVFLGHGEFISRNQVQVDNATLSFSKAVIASGARAAKLDVAGSEDTEILTNETVFSLTELPERLVVIGGGPIGCELAQVFAQLGSQVTQLERSERILPREESDASALVSDSLRRDGVHIWTSTQIMGLSQKGQTKTVSITDKHGQHKIECDAILSAVGRAPNVKGLGLEAAGIKYESTTGITVNDRLQTTNHNVYAAGDVASRYQFTHAADFMARVVIQNALFLGRQKVSSLLIPWATYTSPEVAHVGMYPHEASSQNIHTDCYEVRFSEVDRSILEDETEGFVRVIVPKGKDTILGATIVSPHAGDLISEITVAMKNGIGLKGIASTIHPYPTHAEALRKLGDQFNRTRLTPRVAGLMRRWLKFCR
ncbi:MAG: mercuric reductase [Rubripirellula sp.]|nr:mercuric reductase [Rhodopirellula sp.]MCH1438464.1 mercuric reductase [Rubripirellula sp.]